MHGIRIEPAELDAQSAEMLPDRETLCWAGCVNVQLNLANVTTVQTPVAVSVWGNADAAAQAYINANQGNWSHYYYR